MSRAVDPGAAAAIMAGNSQAVYNDIVEALNSNPADLLDIEFLGKGHPLPPGCNILLDGTSIGIPKLKLVQAFVVARQIFFNCMKDFNEDRFQNIRNATAVILLMDPEHITAANARKRMIQKSIANSQVDLEVSLSHELLIIESFLTSRLHRHTKSPTLWGHRRWVLEIFKSKSSLHDIRRDLTVVVLVAAERHPRNYYAWLHLRWLMHTFRGKDDEAEQSSNILPLVKNWCLKHPADTSGWSFLLFCLFSESSKTARIDSNSSICNEVLSLAISFKWTHESVWVFLRTLVAKRELHEDSRAAFFKTVEASIVALPDDSKAHSIVKTAGDWCTNYAL